MQHQQLQEAAQQGLPEQLVAYIGSARSAGRRVVYIGLGSMLGCMFSSEKATAILAVLAGAVLCVQRQQPCCAIIHCATDLAGGAAVLPHPAAIHSSSSSSSSADSALSAEAAAGPPPYMWLDVPVPHSLLLPLVDLAVHHGGMGTTHAVVAAGVPALVLPVAQAADQSFWGDIIQRRKAGRLACKPASNITAEQLAGDLQEVLSGLAGFKQAAVALSQQMQKRQGKQAAVKFIQGMLGKAGSS
ncbi:hypothetical protein OEZ85_013149 [Tetradesmus obliquus]|uniref:Erythromycin biosynthesis protein CIII-like C-terminal domain-containing protein n=1 Tax=Tetradesmus obliquus TaxID=3088 RepID=A0ABY8U533_TETOB|nr:hypothetical protein OEZ85_013149 [Tetradesmus obliquus]